METLLGSLNCFVASLFSFYMIRYFLIFTLTICYLNIQGGLERSLKFQTWCQWLKHLVPLGDFVWRASQPNSYQGLLTFKSFSVYYITRTLMCFECFVLINRRLQAMVKYSSEFLQINRIPNPEGQKCSRHVNMTSQYFQCTHKLWL